MVSGLLLYGREITFLVKQNSLNKSATPIQDDQVPSTNDINLMGNIKIDVPSENKISVEEVISQPPKEAEDSVIAIDTVAAGLVVGSVADLLEEIKSLASGLTGCPREEAATMFQQLLSRHGNLVGTPYQESLNLVIVGELADKCSINFEPAEIATWWPTADIQNVNKP